MQSLDFLFFASAQTARRLVSSGPGYPTATRKGIRTNVHRNLGELEAKESCRRTGGKDARLDLDPNPALEASRE